MAAPGWEGRVGGKGGLGVCDRHVYIAVFKMDNNVLLYSTGNSAQCYVAAWMGGESGGE